jgi:DNA-binding transcriptional ArsR family regulator
MSLPAVSKHLRKLEDARLIIRTRQGKGYLIQASPGALKAGRDFFNDYESIWNTRLDALGMVLEQGNNNKKQG